MARQNISGNFKAELTLQPCLTLFMMLANSEKKISSIITEKNMKKIQNLSNLKRKQPTWKEINVTKNIYRKPTANVTVVNTESVL